MFLTETRNCALRTGARSVRNIALALSILTLSACADRNTHWSPKESPKKNKVSWAEYHHPVYFSRTSAKLDKAEKDALARFLMRTARGDGVKITLAAGSSDPSPLTKSREASLAKLLMAGGYSVSRVWSDRPVSPRSNAVRVTVGRYIVTPPNCPDWSKKSSGDPFNRVTSNFRCANETNLGLMVANPEALIRGTQIGPADGEAVSLGIGNYRKGEVETPDATSAVEGLGGGGGSSQ